MQQNNIKRLDMKKKGFTLIELLAILVILSIILTIAVPSITGVVNNSTKEAFKSDAKMVLKAVDYKKLQVEDFDATSINKNNINTFLGVSDQNYSSVTVSIEENIPTVTIIGAGKWNGLIACGSFTNMRIVASTSDCSTDVIPPIITILGDNPTNIFIGTTYTDAGVTAIDDRDGNITSRVMLSSNINPNVPGTYTITYEVMDMGGNNTIVTRTVNVIDNVKPIITFNPNGNTTYVQNSSTTINVSDIGGIVSNSLKYIWSTTNIEPTSDLFISTFTDNQLINAPSVSGSYYLWAKASDISGNSTTIGSNVFNIDNGKPIITLNGDNSITINKGSTYIDAGATATDNVDTNIAVTSSGTINPNIIGTYTITYNAVDSSGNAADPVIRTINVVDVLAPVLTINGNNPVNINVNEVYADAGATAIDDVDGDVTDKIVTTGSVNPSIPGAYSITYTVSDSTGNISTATRTVNVIDNIIPTVSFGTNGNTTYAKTRSTTVTVSDNVSVNTSSLKYLWNTSTTAPTEASFSTIFTNGGTISSPVSVTGSYYLWILAKDNADNTTITRTNVFNLDNTAPVIVLNGLGSTTINAGSTYTDAGATATDADSGISGSVTSTGSVNPSAVGTYTITYNVSDNAGNTAVPVTRTVNVVDATNPTVSFGTNGNTTYAKSRSTTVTVSDGGSGINTSSLKYLWNTSTTAPAEASFSTIFTNGGTISSPTSVTGSYYLWILAKDIAGNTLITRTNVFNLDNTIPVLTLNGSATVTITRESTYTDAGATATDNINGNITSSIVVTGTVNPNVIGTYKITYNVSDASGNAATPISRTVNVVTAVPAGWTAIRTAQELYNIRNNLSGLYYIDNNIDLSTSSYSIWAPINSFAGNLDGGGHTVTGLKITNGASSAGLFATITGANVEIKNLSLTSVSITGGSYTGAVVGQVSGSNLKITNVSVSGTISGATYVGGLIGYESAGTIISGSSATGSVSASGDGAGGLIGNPSGTITISGSYTSNSVSSSNYYAGGLIGITSTTANVSSSYATGAITSANYAGGLIGMLATGSTVTTSYATGNVTASYMAGGLIAYASGGTISKSYASGNVTTSSTGNAYSGGLIGYNSAVVSDCYALGNVNANAAASNVGGFIGANYSNVSRIYSIGKVTGNFSSGSVGPVIGYLGSGSLTGLYWVIDTSLIYTSNVPATPINTIVAGTYKSTYSTFDFTNVWDTIEGSTTPYIRGMMLTTKNYISATQNYARTGAGTPSNPYLIKTPEDLNQIRTSLNASFKLANNITLTGTTYATWSPIYNFAGNLDGGGYSIIGLKITNGASSAGLFATITGANVEIKNLSLTSVSITGGSYTGAVVGQVSGSNLKITNVSVSGTISGATYVGGLIGYESAGTIISGSSATGSVSASGDGAGGLIGNPSGTITISGSYTSNSVSSSNYYAGGLIGITSTTANVSSSYATGAITSANYAGGLIGMLATGSTVTTSYATGNVTASYMAGGLIAYASGGTISKSYASGNVTTSSTGNAYSGGLIGYNSAVVSDCYALGNVNANAAASNVGGFIGANYSNVSRIYSIGKVTGNFSSGSVGPVIGYLGSGTLTGLYWNKTTSGITTSNVSATGKTTAEMYLQSTYSGWDFTNIWKTNVSYYPTLR
jgi:prepilin-type N-terminal cleavage/methylation domain-containing protein